MKRNEVIAWREAALADGWTHEPIYKNEAEETAMQLDKEGFHAQVYLRENPSDFCLAVWGPDRLAIEPPVVYNFEGIKRLVNVCEKCSKEGPTVRLAFANRVCPDCRKKFAPTYEAPGWCD